MSAVRIFSLGVKYGVDFYLVSPFERRYTVLLDEETVKVRVMIKAALAGYLLNGGRGDLKQIHSALYLKIVDIFKGSDSVFRAEYVYDVVFAVVKYLAELVKRDYAQVFA